MIVQNEVELLKRNMVWYLLDGQKDECKLTISTLLVAY